MKIELKSVKHFKALSEETPCFEAVVYVDGKKAGVVTNQGQGGPNQYHPTSLYATLKAYADTLPEYSAFGMDGLKVDADTLIFDALDALDLEKHVKQTMKKKVLFTKADGRLYETRKLSPDDVARLTRAGIPDAVVILNSLRLPDAIEAFKAATAKR